MSSPRREWWSCLCSRRCSVRWLMRRVSSAICTSVAPVSVSALPKRVTISRFSSAVIAGMRPVRLAARSPGDAPCALRVGVHLLDQRLRRVEALLAPDALEERQPELLAVAVALVADQERL